MSNDSGNVIELPGRPDTGSAQVAARPAPVLTAQRTADVAQTTARTLARWGPQLRYQIMRVGPTALAGLAALIVSLALMLLLVLPAHQSELTLRAQLAQAASPAAAEVAARAPVALMAALPTRAEIPALLAQMLAQANQAGVALDQGHYDYRPPKAGTLGRYAFEFPIKGAYPDVRGFIDGTLAAMPAVGMEKLRIERKTVGDTAIDATVTFVVFVKGE